MDYEKKYKEALERAKEWFKPEEPDSYTCIVESIFPELKESEGERIRKALIQIFNVENFENYGIKNEEVIAWLKKQGEHARFIEAIQVGDQVTKNEDGVLVNLSQLKRVAKPSEQNQGEQKPDKTFDSSKLKPASNPYWTMAPEYQLANEQKPADKVEPKFKVGDWIINSQGTLRHIINVDKGGYQTDGGWLTHDTYEKTFHLWTIQDAKDGDVLSWDGSKCIALFKNIYDEESFNSYGLVGHCTGTFELRQSYHDIEGAHPATKEQCDLLFQKMKETGYEWDAEKKELKKIEQKPTEWSDVRFTSTVQVLEYAHSLDAYNQYGKEDIRKNINWLKSLRPKSQWKPSREQMNGLKEAIEFLGCTKTRREQLQSLYEQLKKLSEEYV